MFFMIFYITCDHVEGTSCLINKVNSCVGSACSNPLQTGSWKDFKSRGCIVNLNLLLIAIRPTYSLTVVLRLGISSSYNYGLICFWYLGHYNMRIWNNVFLASFAYSINLIGLRPIAVLNVKKTLEIYINKLY